MAISIQNLGGTATAFIRALGSSSVPGGSEGVLGAHLEDLSGRPLAILNGSQLNTSQYALPILAQNDGNGIMLRADRFGSMAIATSQPYFSWMVEGTTINTRRFFNFATTMTAAQTTQGITINSASTTTASTNYQLNIFKQVPLYMNAPISMRSRFRVTQWGIANTSAEFGFTNVNTTLGTTANTNGAYWRFDSSGVIPVLAYNGSIVSLGSDISSMLVNTDFYHWGVFRDDDAFTFTVQNTLTGVVLSRQVIQIPTGQQKLFLSSHAQPYMRVYNSGSAPVSATQIIVSEWTINVLDINFNMTSSQIATLNGLGSENGPLTYTTTSNVANSTVAPTAVPTNTTATTTTLDGAIRMAAPAGAVTDLALFTYQVPNPYQYRCKRVVVAVKNLGAAVATTATQIDFFLCSNASAVTLVGNLNRKYIGTQTFNVGAGIGASANEGRLVLDFTEGDQITEAGRYMILVARISTGTATASQVLEIMYSNIGHFE